MTSMNHTRPIIAALMAATVLVAPHSAHARDTRRVSLNLPAQPLADALRGLAVASGQTVLADADVVGTRSAPAVRGTLTVSEALSLLLAGSGLQSVEVGDAYAVRAAAALTPGEGPQPDTAEILVTGTRIRGAAPAGAQVIAIDRKDIEQSGLATTQAVMAAIPQNFGGGANEGTVGFTQRNNAGGNIGYGSSVNLRGLGTTSTLTLVEGNRLALGGGGGTFVDLSLIPTSAIERIEVLADGASAIYGSDAVAGVVNVRLRRNFEGAETSVRSGLANGFTEFQASQIVGAKWSSGRVMAAYEYYDRSRLGSEDRAYATEDLRRDGGPDYRQAYANPGTITAADGRVFAIPKGQEGTHLSASDLIADVSNLGDGRSETDLLPATRRHAGVIALEHNITPDVTLRLQGFAADRRSSQRYFALNSSVTVTSANPFYVDPIGTGLPVSVGYDFREDLGAPRNEAHVTNWAASGAIEAKLGAWRGEVYGSYGEQHERLETLNEVNSARLAAALADPDPATAFNVFGDGSHTSSAAIDKVRGSALQVDRSRQTTAGLKLDGPLFALPGGALRLAVGAEYRAEAFGSAYVYDDFSLAPIAGGDAGYPLSRHVVAGYAELLAPLVGPEQGISGIHRLEVSVAGRIEHYSDFGTTTNPKVGVTWEPVEGLAVRGAYGTSFHAPGFFDVRQGPGLSQVVPLPVADSASPTGSSNVVALFGNNPAIGPERARTLTAGLDIRPRAVPGLSLSATWFDVSYRDRIFNPAIDAFTFLIQRDRYASLITANPSAATVAALYADPNFANPFGIPASAISTVIDARNANLARNRLDGIDFDLGYRKAIPGGAIAIGASGTWLFHLTQQLTASSPSVEALGTIGNPVRYRVRGRASLELGGVGLAAFVNHTAGYRNTAVSPVEQVASWTTLDMQVSKTFGAGYGPMRGTRLSLSVTNLFNANPPYVNNRTPYSASGFDPEQASAAGRVIALQLVKAW